jgi:hypothetical protein
MAKLLVVMASPAFKTGDTVSVRVEPAATYEDMAMLMLLVFLMIVQIWVSVVHEPV